MKVNTYFHYYDWRIGIMWGTFYFGLWENPLVEYGIQFQFLPLGIMFRWELPRRARD